MATAQKPGEKKLPAPHRPFGQSAFAGRIVGNHALVPFELAPGDVALVLILEQHIPFGQWTPQTALHALAAFLDADLAHRPAEGIRSAIYGVVPHFLDAVV